MLDCASNYKCGYKQAICDVCKTCDNEHHRINYCVKYQARNLYKSSLKVDFKSIYSENVTTVDRIIDVICELWELDDGKNQMRV